MIRRFGGAKGAVCNDEQFQAGGLGGKLTLAA